MSNPDQSPSFERMFHAACLDLAAINEALDLDPDDGGAAPILEAIAELKARATPAPAIAASPEHGLPLGAIVNGKTCIDRLERDYAFQCEGGPLAMCADWDMLKRCFFHLAEHAQEIAQRDPDPAVGWPGAAIAAGVPAEPAYWEYRWKDTHPQTVTSGQWYPWERVVPRNGHLETVESRLAELRGYIAQGRPYEIRALYAGQAPVANQPADASPDTHGFKNFHRALCARFGYTHDEVHWRRDLVSLEEHISSAIVQAELNALAVSPSAEWLKRAASLAGELDLLAKIQDEKYPNFRIICVEAAAALRALAPKGDSNG